MKRCCQGRPKTGWVSAILSGAALVCMPKCPLCLAAYVALFTGAGLSVEKASHLRTALLAVCGAALLGSAAMILRPWAARPPR